MSSLLGLKQVKTYILIVFIYIYKVAVQMKKDIAVHFIICHRMSRHLFVLCDTRTTAIVGPTENIYKIWFILTCKPKSKQTNNNVDYLPTHIAWVIIVGPLVCSKGE